MARGPRCAAQELSCAELWVWRGLVWRAQREKAEKRQLIMEIQTMERVASARAKRPKEVRVPRSLALSSAWRVGLRAHEHAPARGPTRRTK